MRTFNGTPKTSILCCNIDFYSNTHDGFYKTTHSMGFWGNFSGANLVF